MLPIIGQRYEAKEDVFLPKINDTHKPFIRRESIVIVTDKSDLFVTAVGIYARGNYTFKIPKKKFNSNNFKRTNKIRDWESEDK